MNELLNLKNVVGFGNGFRTVKGERIGEATVVLVTKKLPLEMLAAQDVIPQAIDGNVTDVLEVGEIKALTYNHRLRPIQPGSSIGHFGGNVTAGTFGAIVEDTHTGRKLILSNNHVLADMNDASEGDPIVQPGVYDGGNFPADHIGNLFRFVPIQFGEAPPTCPIATGTATGLNKVAELLGRSHRLEAKKVTPLQANLVDAAVATISVEFNDEILDIGKINGTAEVSLGDQVQKTGRTTEHTTGQVLVVDATVNVSYGDKGSALFTNQIISGPMSAPGDSGSAVLDMQGNIVGLLFAGSEKVTIYNPWLFVSSGLRIGV